MGTGDRDSEAPSKPPIFMLCPYAPPSHPTIAVRPANSALTSRPQKSHPAIIHASLPTFRFVAVRPPHVILHGTVRRFRMITCSRIYKRMSLFAFSLANRCTVGKGCRCKDVCSSDRHARLAFFKVYMPGWCALLRPCVLALALLYPWLLHPWCVSPMHLVTQRCGPLVAFFLQMRPIKQGAFCLPTAVTGLA